ncbi:MAG: alpha/beta hydrolase fold domain-containing protein, partial [Bacteroidota bacterium]
MYRLLFLLCCCSLFLHAQGSDTVAYREVMDLPYLAQADSLQELNLILPTTTKKPPLLLWLGGGAWAFVNKDLEMTFARKLAREGIAVASVGHRLSTAVWVDPERTEGVQHPAHAEDAAAAFHWLKTHAAEYGYDPEKIFIG